MTDVGVKITKIINNFISFIYFLITEKVRFHGFAPLP